MHSLSTFGARTNHGQPRTHKTHHGDLGEATTFPLIVYYVPLHQAHIQMAFFPKATTFPFIVYYVPLHEAHIQMAFCPETLKWEFRNSQS
jgi:hypothetical protein